MNRRRPAHRLTSALIGAIITALGVLTGALLSGRDLDTELIAIVALAAAGVWLMITALLSARRPRSGSWAPESGAWAAGPGVDTTPGTTTPAPYTGHEGTPPHGEASLTTAARTAASKAQGKAASKSTDIS